MESGGGAVMCEVCGELGMVEMEELVLCTG
jgi:hypothetical protein